MTPSSQELPPFKPWHPANHRPRKCFHASGVWIYHTQEQTLPTLNKCFSLYLIAAAQLNFQEKWVSLLLLFYCNYKAKKEACHSPQRCLLMSNSLPILKMKVLIWQMKEDQQQRGETRDHNKWRQISFILSYTKSKICMRQRERQRETDRNRDSQRDEERKRCSSLLLSGSDKDWSTAIWGRKGYVTGRL